MKLSEILSPDRVVSGTAANSKKKALEELAGLLGSGSDNIASADVFSSLTGREKLGSTGLGHGVAIPHGRIGGIDRSVGAFIRLKHPVDYEAHDGHPVDLVFGLLVPEEATDEHLQHLAAVAEIFSDNGFCQKLRETDSSRELHQMLAGFETSR